MALDKAQLLRHIFIDKKIRENMEAGQLANCSNMAREYEVSTKTILRDIDFLKNQRQAPIAYDSKRHGYYYQEESYSLPAISLNESDLFAICIAEKALRQYESTPIHQKLSAVFRKIESSLPKKVSVNPSWMDSRLSVAREHQTRLTPEVWESVAQALRKRQPLQILYQKPDKLNPVVRNVEPYHVVRHQGEWYLLAHCQLREEQRTFAVSRIKRAQMLPNTFVVPTDFDAERLLEKQFGIFSGEEEFQVLIHFSKEHAPYVQERVWHPGQSLAQRPDGGVELGFSATHLYEVMRWVLSWGSGAQVVKPAKLVAMVRKELTGALDSYGDGSSS